MPDIKRRVDKLEDQFVPPNPLADKSINELEEMAEVHITKHFNRKLSKPEMKRALHLVAMNVIKLDAMTERDLLPSIPK